MGVRELRHAVPRLSVAGRCADGARAHRGRGARPPADRLLPVGRAAHPLGRGRRLRRVAPVRRGGGREAGRHQSESVRVGRVPAGQPLQPGPGRARPCAGALPRVRRDRASRRLEHDQPLARRRDQLPRPGRPPGEVRTAGRGPRAALRGAVRRPHAPRRVQVLRARLLQHGSPGLGDRSARLPASRPSRQGARRHRPSPARDERRADRRRCSWPRGSSAASTSTTGSTPTTI